MRRAAAVCSQYDRPTGVTFSFQVCRYSIEPTFANRATNLLAKDMLRSALTDEIEEYRPEVPRVFVCELFPCVAERLTWA